MYRLLNAKNIYPNGFHNFTVSKNIANANTLKEIKCLFCQKMLLDYGLKGIITVCEVFYVINRHIYFHIIFFIVQ